MPTDRLPPEVEDWLEEHGDSQSYQEALQLIARLAPQQPMNQDEQGGCVWCGKPLGSLGYGYAGRKASDHNEDCPWLAADRLLQGHPEIKRAEDY